MNGFIKNIIFDLGNVLLPIDYTVSLAKFQQYSTTKLTLDWFNEIAPVVIEDHEVGKLDNATFCEKLRNYARLHCSDQDIQNAWNALLLKMPFSRFVLLERLAPYFNLYLLSNTNAMHQNVFEKDIVLHTKKTLSSFFKKAYYSHEIELRKPHTSCYNFVLKDGQMEADETLFIDDNHANILGAMTVGIHTLHLQQFDSLVTQLSHVLNIPEKDLV